MGTIARVGVPLSAAIIDVGGGASRLTASLLERGYSDLSVLDISAAALSIVKQMLGDQRDDVEFIVEDLLHWKPERRYDLWHDRAVFHFLTEESQQRTYAELLQEAIAPNGYVVLSAFATDGPAQCSGLDVKRYSPDELASIAGGGFDEICRERIEHVTPGGSVQPFTWVVLRRTGP